MSTRKIVANTLYYGVVPKLTMLLSIVILPLTTPFLSTFDYGIYGVVSSYTSLLIPIASLGLNVHLTNSYYEYPRHYHLVWGRILGLLLFSSLLFGILNMAVLSYTLPMAFSWKLLSLCALASMTIFLLANGLLAQHLFPLLELPKHLVFTNLAGSVLGILTSFVLIYYFHKGYWGLVSSGAVSSIFCFTVFVKFVWVDYNIWPIIDRNLRRVKRMLKIALPLVPHTLGFVLLTSSARIVMSQCNISYDEIGLFTHGSTMGDYGVILTTALVTALIPQMQRAYRNADFKTYRKLYYLCQAVALAASFGICVWMPEIYSLLIRNDQLAQSSDIARLLCFANVVQAFYLFISTPVFIHKNTLHLLWLVFVPGVLNFTLCYALIPFFGYRAAIFSTIVSYWSQLLIPFVVSYYKHSVREWLGSRKILVGVLVVIIADLVLANIAMQAALLGKILLTVLIMGTLWMFYRHEELNKVV